LGDGTLDKPTALTGTAPFSSTHRSHMTGRVTFVRTAVSRWISLSRKSAFGLIEIPPLSTDIIITSHAKFSWPRYEVDLWFIISDLENFFSKARPTHMMTNCASWGEVREVALFL